MPKVVVTLRDKFRRRARFFSYANNDNIPGEVWAHTLWCECAVCNDFYGEVDYPDNTCWVTGDELVWR